MTPEEQFGLKPKREPQFTFILYCVGVICLYYCGLTGGF